MDQLENDQIESIEQVSDNWTEQILCGLVGFFYVLSPSGIILYCSKSCLYLTGYMPQELVGKPLNNFIHANDIDIFEKYFVIAFQTRSKVKMYYRFIKKDTCYLLLETIGHLKKGILFDSPQVFCAMSKPYLSRNGHLFDSMLELKMENDRLKHRVRQLSSLSKQIVNEERDTQLPAFFWSDEEKNTLLEDNKMNNVKNDYSLKTSPSPLSPIAYSKLAISAGSSSNMPREPPISSQEEWENPRGAYPIKKSPGSTISTTPAGSQIQNQTTVSLQPLSVDDEGDIPIKKSKRKQLRKYVCNDCGTTTSPEWRKGPDGPKTLCNACGLRWAKRNRKCSNMH
ncbi:GATA-domain-containing protein [Rhizopus microsporus var. microsporus]|uniref:GATA-domain-containing protein n=2 Tax=Rhizopus microsporus TaxID=58291 RepID=A0A2G4T4Q9_RHIZD|nr:GATA-domain-containing protein [Rhizopus microsporus ATCC 52813]ORE07023.1 GATA-domain-containing protein [Rhizopus microsporus var. microsporus]PHZ16001.1 GATA-domain-containing protein [Rhizopus microsporus ATCC 52813]